MSDFPQSITLELTEAESSLIETLVREGGFASPEAALRALLHDALWDKTFDASQDLLDQLADQAHADYLAGLTEDFDHQNCYR